MRMPRRFLRVTLMAILAGLLLMPLVDRATGQTRGSQPAAGTGRTAPKRRTSGQVTMELKALLARECLPWQGYRHYADFYLDSSERVQKKKVSSEAAQALQREWVDFYRRLGELVNEMGAQQRIKDEIKANNSPLPQAQRARAFLTARAKYRECHGQFLDIVAHPPPTSQRRQPAQSR